MFLALFLAPPFSLKDFTSAQYGENCYFFSNIRTSPYVEDSYYGSYDQADKMCRDIGATLVDIADDLELKAVSDIASKHMFHKLRFCSLVSAILVARMTPKMAAFTMS